MLQKVLLLVMFSLTLSTSALAFYYKEQSNIRHKSKLEVQHHINSINKLAKEIRIATYPSTCDELTQKITGKECDIGNYMEWAGPQLEDEVQQLLVLLDH